MNKKVLFQLFVKNITVKGWMITLEHGDRKYYSVGANWKIGTWYKTIEDRVGYTKYDDAVAACRNMMEEIKEQIEKEVK